MSLLLLLLLLLLLPLLLLPDQLHGIKQLRLKVIARIIARKHFPS